MNKIKRVRDTYIMLFEILTLLLVVFVAILSQSAEPQICDIGEGAVVVEIDVPMTPEIPVDDGNHAPYFVYIGAKAI